MTSKMYDKIFIMLLLGRDPDEVEESEHIRAAKKIIRDREVKMAKRAFDSILQGYAK